MCARLAEIVLSLHAAGDSSRHQVLQTLRTADAKPLGICRAWRQRCGARCRGGALPGSRMPRRLRRPRRPLPSQKRSSPKMPRQQRQTTAVPSRRRLQTPASLHRQHQQQQRNRRRRLPRLQRLPQTRRLQDRQRSKPTDAQANAASGRVTPSDTSGGQSAYSAFATEASQSQASG